MALCLARRGIGLLLLCTPTLAACHLLMPYEARDDGAVGPSDARGDGRGDRGQDAVDRGDGLVDARPSDGDGDLRAPIPDAGAACVTNVALWAGTCRGAAHPNSCGIGCGIYTVVCVGSSCTCAITDGDSHVCSGITATAASCEPASACFEAVSTGCCAWQ